MSLRELRGWRRAVVAVSCSELEPPCVMADGGAGGGSPLFTSFLENATAWHTFDFRDFSSDQLPEESGVTEVLRKAPSACALQSPSLSAGVTGLTSPVPTLTRPSWLGECRPQTALLPLWWVRFLCLQTGPHHGVMEPCPVVSCGCETGPPPPQGEFPSCHGPLWSPHGLTAPVPLKGLLPGPAGAEEGKGKAGFPPWHSSCATSSEKRAEATEFQEHVETQTRLEGLT